MKKRITITAFFLLSALFVLQAQNNDNQVKIYQDEAIENLLNTPSVRNTPSGGGDIGGVPLTADAPGVYAILVFSSSEPGARQTADARHSALKRRYPDLNVRKRYEAPIWRVTAGSYSSRSAAEAALSGMKSAFAFGGEMYVIKVGKK
jgi:hypothetical protein